MPEVTEEDAALIGLQKAIWADPKAKLYYAAALKAHDPKLSIPELDIPARAAAAVDAKLKEIEKVKTEIEAGRIKDGVEREWSGVVGTVITSEERPEVEKFMEKESIGSIAAAAELFAHRKQKATPATPRVGPSAFSMPHQHDRWKGLFEAPDRWARNDAYQALNEIQTGQIKFA